MINNKGISNILVISIVLVLLGVGGYFGYTYTKKSQAPINNEPTTTQSLPIAKKPLPTDQELIDSIRNDLQLSKEDEITINYKDFDKPTKENRLYVITEKYEVIAVGYRFANHVVARPINEGKWKEEFGTQQAYECKILDNLGFSRAQTIEWGCFEYDTQIYRK